MHQRVRIGVRPWLLGAILVVALAPFAVLLVRAPFQDWYPVGDPATIALRVREVFGTSTPLVGPYSHFGWAHPGPLLFYSLAVPYRLFGTHIAGLLIGALLINTAAVVVAGARLTRRGGVAVAMLGVAMLGAVSWSLGTSRLWSIWNPDIAVLPFAALIVVVWTMRPGARWDLPLVALLASFVAQAHIGYLPLVVILGAWAVVYRVLPANRRRVTDPRAPRFERRVTLVILGLAWAPVLLDAVLHRGGNLRDIARFWFAGHDTLGLPEAFRIVCYELSFRGRLFGGAPPLFLGSEAPRGFPVPVTLLVLLGALVLAWRRNDWFAARACCLICLLIVTAILSVARIVGLVYPYLLNFLPAVVAAAWLAAAWTVLRAIDARCGAGTRRSVPWITAGVAVAMMVALVVSASSAGIGSAGEDQASQTLSVLMPRVRASLAEDAARLHLDSTRSFFGGSFRAGVLFDLAAHGADVTAGVSDRLYYGDGYVGNGAGARQLLVTSGPAEFHAAAADRPLIATSGPAANFPPGAPPLGPGEDPGRYLIRVHPIVDPSTYRRLERYLTSTNPVAIFGETGKAS